MQALSTGDGQFIPVQEVARRFLAAWEEGDTEALVGWLAPDAAVHGDGGGKAPSVPVPLVGAERVMMGTDYCFDIAYTQPVQVVEQTPGLSGEERSQILGGNARRLLRLTATPPEDPSST